MDIEELVQKYKEDAPLCSYDFDQSDAETMLRAALTELAAGYEEQQALLLDAHCERVNLLQERIHQFEVEREGMALVPRELLDKFPELNINNYSHDDVDELNSWGIELLLASVPRRCHLCNYQHGHQIGCENNPVDIAMLAAAPQQKKEGE